MEWKTLNYSGETIDLLNHFADEPYVFLLDSSVADPKRGRYSFIGFDPFAVIKSKDKDSFAYLKKKFQRYHCRYNTLRSPFPSGMMGYFTYDFGLPFENIARKNDKPAIVPDFLFGFYDCILTVDHFKKKLYISSSGFPETRSYRQKERAQKRLVSIVQRLDNLSLTDGGVALDHHPLNGSRGKLKSNFSKTAYYKTINKVLDYIRRGDIYQVNLSQQFYFDASPHEHINTIRLYSLLRKLSPSCFSGYMNCGDFQIISSSPERFLRLRGQTIEARPMKGTRARGNNAKQDQRLQRELKASSKDKAELLMITDLLRNDLGRVCEYGSVKVKSMRDIEKYSTVFQATSTIQGTLKNSNDCFDVLEAAFPGGSITGCPKIRAMQIIEELEPTARSIYTGSMGYISFNGDMDFNVLIRTLLVKEKKVYFHVGGGIVADSTPENEYEETLVKAKALQECLAKSFNGVTP